MYPNENENVDLDKSDKADVKVNEGKHVEEAEGQLSSQNKQDKLMHSVLENDKETIDDGKLLSESINQGLGAFSPDMMFEQLVKNYSMAKQLYGETIIREASGYSPDYVQKNIKIPEFQRELEKKIKDRMEDLKKKGMIDKEGMMTDEGLELASLVTYVEELNKLEPKGFFGQRVSKRKSFIGVPQDFRDYKKGDRYHDISVRKTIKTAMRRGHSKIIPEDLKVSDKESKSHVYIVYALDASGSMRGNKISLSKKAGIALAYKAINEKDKVGLIVFGKTVKEKVLPTTDFMELLRKMTSVRASAETNITATIKEAITMFPNKEVTKHLMLLTDALPTTGDDPEKEVLEQASIAKNHNITISVVGINLDKKGRKLAEKIVEIGDGRMYVIKDIEELDRIVLEDYYSL